QGLVNMRDGLKVKDLSNSEKRDESPTKMKESQ
ncbi:MAG: hypothetical protein ACJAXN_002963, partial [Psychromonas sp.]